ncbi:MAG: MarR family transcriptional regulator [Candidatus Melainabacteria bacterium]|nr:MarR family transcriptional regulator [Candidatus Melainabacteria bacterium]
MIDEDHDIPRLTRERLKENIGFLLHRPSLMWRERLDQALAPLNLSVMDYGVLRLLELNLVEYQQQIGLRLDLDPSRVVELMNALEERELIQRLRNAKDKRKYNLSLTPKGRKTLSRAKTIANKEQTDFLSVLDQKEQKSLLEALWKLANE